MQGVLIIGGQALPVRISPGEFIVPPGAVVARDGDQIWVHWDEHTYELTWRDAVTHLAGFGEDDRDATSRAPMPGLVIAVMVTVGDAVNVGDALLTIESMKMETVVRAPRDGIVEAVFVATGSSFDRDAPLVRLVEVE